MRLIAHRRPVLTAAAAANHLDPEPVATHFLEQKGKPASSANGKGEVKEEQKNDRQAGSHHFLPPPTTPTRKTGKNVGCYRHLIIPVKGLRVPHIDVHHPERVQQG